MTWSLVCSLDRLKEKKKLVFKEGKKQVVVWDLGDKVFAFDNRCPHEGYPLLQGDLNQDCVLTCNWHNWKFDVRSGDCTLGGDNLRVYPVQVQDDQVLVDLSDPDPEVIKNEILKGVEQAFVKNKNGRMTRELARFSFNDFDLKEVLIKGIQWSYNRLEYGMTHAYAAACDWLALYEENKGDRELQVLCITEAIMHMSHDCLREQNYAFSEKSEPFSAASFLNAIESENEDSAVACLRGALASGVGEKELELVFSQAALAHYQDFGHALIYVNKAFGLIRVLGEPVKEPLLLALTRSLVFATREDLLPEFKNYVPTLKQFQLCSNNSDHIHSSDDVFGESVDHCLLWTKGTAAFHSPLQVYETLLQAAARNLLHFDTSYQDAFDRPVSDNVGWLDFTHALTFANAVRLQCSEFPELWPQGLLQMACFVGRNSRYIDADLNVSQWEDIDQDQLQAALFAKLYDHGMALPIFSSHILKTGLAVLEEIKAAQTPETKNYLKAGINRLLNSPIKQKHIRRAVKQGLALVQKDFS